jgi:hypothetical protein
MSREAVDAFGTFAVIFICVVIGFWTGVQIGVVQSHQLGTYQACKNIQFTILDCETAKAPTP